MTPTEHVLASTTHHMTRLSRRLEELRTVRRQIGEAPAQRLALAAVRRSLDTLRADLEEQREFFALREEPRQ